tara:strand:+ start:16088 stop:16801 length:714 start_codon:yes stop_codon:yes gene_type:complete
MHYYKFNISDYRKDTSHLSLLEHGIYRMLIDTYYLDEKPLNDDIAKLMRSHCVRIESEQVALKNVLDDFFSLKEDGYHHKGCDQRLTEIYAKSEKARDSAKARWQKDANALRTVCEEDANGMLPITYNPLPTTQIKDKESKIPPCPHGEIIKLYHKVLPELQSVNESLWKGSQREKDLSARWKQNEEFRKREFWEWFFTCIKNTPFDMGENDRHWKVDLGWLLKKENFIKRVEKFSS